MVIDDTTLYDDIWNWVHTTLHFSPNGLDKGHGFPYGKPFRIPFPYAVYGIEFMTEAQVESMTARIQQAFLNAAVPGQRIYALDWQHSCFLYDPRKESDIGVAWVQDPRYPEGGYYASFPGFYPDGDYFFFIDEHLEFGYLGHPWRQEVWIFGDALLKEFDKIYQDLGWIKLDIS